MLNTNISFQEARKNGYAINEDKMNDSITIFSPFSRELLTITGKEEGMVEVKIEGIDSFYASKVNIEFIRGNALEAVMLRINIEIPTKRELCKECICTIIESKRNVAVNYHYN